MWIEYRLHTSKVDEKDSGLPLSWFECQYQNSEDSDGLINLILSM